MASPLGMYGINVQTLLHTVCYNMNKDILFVIELMHISNEIVGCIIVYVYSIILWRSVCNWMRSPVNTTMSVKPRVKSKAI